MGLSGPVTLWAPLRRRVRGEAGLGVSGLSSGDISSPLRDPLLILFNWNQSWIFFFSLGVIMLYQHENERPGMQSQSLSGGVWPTFLLILSVKLPAVKILWLVISHCFSSWWVSQPISFHVQDKRDWFGPRAVW